MAEDSSEADLGACVGLVKTSFPSVQVRVKSLRTGRLPSEVLRAAARAFALARIKNPESSVQQFEPMLGEIDYEMRALKGGSAARGIVYDGRLLADAFREHFLGRLSASTACVIVTDRLVTTYSRDDLRHHLRTVVCGFPSLVSLPGIVEAPARPREYYLARHELQMRGASEVEFEQLKSAFGDRFIDYGDPRVPQVVEGLLLQAVMYHLTLNPFCSDRRCRNFNAHWQEDLIFSQVVSRGLCARHSRETSALGKRPAVRW